MVKLSIEEIRGIIRPVGLSPMKSKGIHGLSKILIDKYDGKVPKTFEALESLPAVGHKTASVVLSQAFGIPTFPVDTHIHRLMFRWGLSNGKNVKKTEEDAKRLFPKKLWNKITYSNYSVWQEIFTSKRMEYKTRCNYDECRKKIYFKKNDLITVNFMLCPVLISSRIIKIKTHFPVIRKS